MKMRMIVFTLVMMAADLFLNIQQAGAKFIPYNHKLLTYEGRVGITNSCAEFYWSGNNVTIQVQGAKAISAKLADNIDNNFLYIVVDGDAAGARKLMIGKTLQSYNLANFTDAGRHVVQLFKITNTDEHIIRFYGFDIDQSAQVLKPQPRPKRRIEFFGNSITCGHGVDVAADSADSGAPKYFNNYWAYGAITARHFGAQYHCTAKSGIGIMVSWFREIMPEIYDRLNPLDVSSKWNFKLYQPDIVVVNLFQNDSWLVNNPTHAQFKARFGTAKPTEAFIINAYADFLKLLRKKYPAAQIICALGNMDATRENSAWPGYIDAAASALQDTKITTHFFAYKNTPGHPKRNEQQAMAKDLISFIEAKNFFKK